MKPLKMILLGLALLIALTVYATADCRNRISLVPTSEGAAIDAGGNAEVRQQRARERFKVQVEADVADGTTFTIFADGQLAGTLTTVAGRGELELDNEHGTLPAELMPVCNIRTVDVVDDSDTLILHGDF